MITRRAILGAGALAPVPLISARGRSRRVPNYKPIAPVQVTSAPDTSGMNSGNLTAAFPSEKLPGVSVYEIHHMMVTGGTFLDSATIVVANRQWSTVTLDLSGGNEWDPSAPLMMLKDWDLYFLWDLPAATTPRSVVTVWARFDPGLPENAAYGSFGGAP